MRSPGIFKAEAFDTMQYFYRTAHDPLVRACIRLDGHIDEGTLKSAVRLSARAIPLIFCRFSVSAWKPKWEAAGYTAEDAVRVLETSGEGEDFAERLLASSTIDIFKEPQVKILIARGQASDTLCVLMSHLVCDGGGFKDYLYLLCRLYNSMRDNPAYDEALKAPPRGLGQIYSPMSPLDQILILAEKDELGKQKNGLAVRLQGDEASPFIARRDIPAESFERVRGHAKMRGATVNDMLLAAYARVLSRETGERKITIPCPVDLRKYLPGGEARYCNLTSNLFCEAEIEPGEPFDATLGKVAESMAGQKDSKACLKGPLLYGMVYPFVSFHWLEKNFNSLFTIPVTSTTNLGVLDTDRLAFAGVGISGAYMTAAIKRVPYFQVTASTYRNCCTLTCNLHGTQQDRVFIERFLEQMGMELTF